MNTSLNTVESAAEIEPKATVGLFGWLKDGTPDARRGLYAASAGWGLDGFAVMLYALVITSLIPALHLTKGSAGLLGSIPLVTSGIGGLGFGFLADRFGRRGTMIGAILLYSLFTFACGFATSLWMLLIFRALLGLGMGGEWTSGAALVSESWSAKNRGKALAFMQSSWAVGYAGAAIVAAIILPRYGWRAVFFVGILPAFLTLWVQHGVKESKVWIAHQAEKSTARAKDHLPISAIFRGQLGRMTFLLTMLSIFVMFAYWGLNLWVPAYLSLPTAQGGLALGASWTTILLVTMQTGTFFGYLSFGYVADAFGRRPSFVAYLLSASVLVLVYISTHNPWLLMIFGPLVAFFGTGVFSGFGAVSAEIFPTSVRATAQGLTFNAGRMISGFAPFVVGTLAQTHGFAWAFVLTAISLALGATMWFWIPETRGRNLT